MVRKISVRITKTIRSAYQVSGNSANVRARNGEMILARVASSMEAGEKQFSAITFGERTEQAVSNAEYFDAIMRAVAPGPMDIRAIYRSSTDLSIPPTPTANSSHEQISNTSKLHSNPPSHLLTLSRHIIFWSLFDLICLYRTSEPIASLEICAVSKCEVSTNHSVD